MCPVNLDEYNDSQQRSAQRALDKLDKLDGRLDSHFSGKRRHARRPFRGQATVRYPSAGDVPPTEFTVWTRSISESGLSFICPHQICEEWILVGLEPVPGQKVWFAADIRRQKAVPEESFWELGVSFRGRIKD